eukprot:TRINITY_DN9304_c0_g1_i1.p1 TRINITY_DN9304_c0_g1~~TRINITY_DN9304_c0_g1_i1.p1  ORF type:complete len:343 (-),score=90.23 TRINITY_DN9304_c0_g1_i1:95-1123(-)
MEWGLVIYDEVQKLPSRENRKTIFSLKSHCELGLTATLVKEDDTIEDLNYLIGPKLYEENWLDLVNLGFLARAQCFEVRLQMHPKFQKPYEQVRDRKKERKFYFRNPEKFYALQFLIEFHKRRGDKIIVFTEDIFSGEEYRKHLDIPFIYGKVPPDERTKILKSFAKKPEFHTLMLSRVGNEAIDLPAANVLIQISFMFGSRMEEAQRMGRILRPKENMKGRFNAFFYTLVTLGTEEMEDVEQRQRFLIDQGYSYQIVAKLPYMTQPEKFGDYVRKMKRPEEVNDYLERVMRDIELSNRERRREVDDDSGFSDFDDGPDNTTMATMAMPHTGDRYTYFEDRS